ncbi:hypothetical protein [Pseudoroseomonas cervicalis]|uniref:hypothetical protein n=1 Tax=Teichococcus cervicalis TaxID=204525 RepID=UPI0022F1D64C|nr:hypothetical protein [Pseudoroseomonas cervicalis]WBV43959.1 hypothetical protein PFY06_05155 [Pseudoroseomonas cervicalis]
MPELLVLLPFGAALLLAALPLPRLPLLGLNLLASAGGLALAACLLVLPREPAGLLHLDALNLALLLPGALLGLCGALAWAMPAGGTPAAPPRGSLAGYQLALGAHHLALLADHLGLMWLAVQGGLLALALLLGQQGRPGRAAAVRVLLPGGAAIGLALLGVLLLGIAAWPHAGDAALSWTALRLVAREADPALLGLGFAGLLVAQASLAVLLPPLAGRVGRPGPAGGPAFLPLLAALLLGTAALHALARAQAVAGLAVMPGMLPSPGALMLLAGLLALLLAGGALLAGRGGPRRLPGWCGVAQLGLAGIGFGLGGPASLAGLLHLMGALLLLGGLCLVPGLGAATAPGWPALRPAARRGAALALLGLAGLPPFALFASDFLLVQQMAARLAWLSLPLGIGLLLLALSLLRALHRLLRVPAAPGTGGETLALLPAGLALAAALLLGIALPAPLGALLAEAAGLLP